MAANNIAKWADGSWHSLGGGVPGPAHFMGSTPNGGIAVWSGAYAPLETSEIISTLSLWDGHSWSHLPFMVAQDPSLGSVHLTDMLVRRNGDVVICGSFSSIDGVPAKGVAVWDGRSWHASMRASARSR
jgi:hypothetical protein